MTIGIDTRYWMLDTRYWILDENRESGIEEINQYGRTKTGSQ